MPKFYFDPGHGGSDSGAVGNGLKEKDITLSIAKAMEKYLKENYEDVQIKMSRIDDTFPTLTERTNEANEWGADCFVSIHINAHTNTAAKGFSSYVYPNPGADTIAFQNVLHEEIMRAIGGNNITDRGKLQANFHVLRESNMKACLTENLFISNPSDAALLKKNDVLNQFAKGHALGLVKFYGLKQKTVSPPPSSTLYRVIAGTFSSEENARKQVDRLKADGYESYIDVK